MRFSWDPYKSAATLDRRKFDFAFASQIFDGETIERTDGRREYGEQRIIATGMAEEFLITVIYTDRLQDGETVRRIISARGASRNERKAYSQVTGQVQAIQGEGRPRLSPQSHRRGD